LEASIRSVLEQDFRDLELIVVDDGSSDATGEIAHAIPDARLHYIYQANTGVAGALNTAYRASRGEYLAIQNDDDLWLPGKLELQVRQLEAQPEVGLVYGKAQVIDGAGCLTPQFISIPGKYPGQMVRSLLHEDCICPATVLARRSCLEAVVEPGANGPWDASLPGVDDWDLWLRLACCCDFAYLDKTIAHYRAHAANTSGRRSAHFAAFQERRVKVLDKFFSRSACASQSADMRPVAYRNLYTIIGLQWAAAGRWKEAVNYFQRAFRAAPSPATFTRILGSLGLHLISQTPPGARLISAYARWRVGRRARNRINET
ncbi:MAG TPA: glycosyltransferase, partial [Anaerolineales bacterium]